MTEDQFRLWDTLIKGVGLLGLVVGGLFTYWQYFDGVKRQERTNQIAANSPFLTQRQELYGQAIQAVATLATATDAKTLHEATDNFWKLYWGPLATVESRAVEALMVEMGNCLNDPGCTADSKHDISLRLAHQIRDENTENWEILLPKLAGQK